MLTECNNNRQKETEKEKKKKRKKEEPVYAVYSVKLRACVKVNVILCIGVFMF